MTIIRGKIWASNSRYFTVTVFPTLKAMRAWCKKTCKKNSAQYMGDRALGVCHSWQRIEVRPGKKTRTHPEIGEIHFAETRASTDVVSHECAHAAFYYLRRKHRVQGDLTLRQEPNSRFTSGMEEEYCAVLGRMFWTANKELHRLGIWK